MRLTTHRKYNDYIIPAEEETHTHIHTNCTNNVWILLNVYCPFVGQTPEIKHAVLMYHRYVLFSFAMKIGFLKIFHGDMVIQRK